ncbi:MAG: hypothetical protein GY846_26730 [Deltaproteobacteria bacterium]|nr:hypothetical protein [Deltaproteobacteria bacterium]
MDFKMPEGIIDVSFLNSQQIIGRFHMSSGAAAAVAASVVPVVPGGLSMA